MNLTVSFVKTRPEAQLPEYKTSGAVGADLASAIDTSINPGQWKAIACGFAVALPQGYEAQIRPRSGMARSHGVTVLNSPGTIDFDYRGEVQVVLINHSSEVFEVKKGDRIAQMIISPVLTRADFVVQEVECLDETARGSGGFGSTGRN
jgi:dUTP pyrophosphatase